MTGNRDFDLEQALQELPIQQVNIPRTCVYQEEQINYFHI